MTARHRHNLPAEYTRFVGREVETRELVRLVERVRLITLLGAGGIGKSRLACRVAARLAGRFEHGVQLVDLSPLADAALLDATVAATLDLDELPGVSARAALLDQLRDRELLLVLDNCEHLAAACAHLVADLLSACCRPRHGCISSPPAARRWRRSARRPGACRP